MSLIAALHKMKVYGLIAVAAWLVQALQGSPLEVHVSEGKTVELKCLRVSALPVGWQKYQGGSLIPLLDHNEDGHFSLAADNRSLTVQRARKEHSGLYYCQSRKLAYLTVDPPLKEDQPGASEENEAEDTNTSVLGSAHYWGIRVGVAVAVGVAVGVVLGATLVLLIQRKNRSTTTLQNHRSDPTPDPVVTSAPTSDGVYDEVPDQDDVL
ncbi:uncharacterized protein LOC115540042 isoform X1 [Gadus morhua]|uniref:uncharacterized protein LOC115540042 isoform X1 n=1 Tax=Gadus morhua TaxID=8049 RepID=UPI0011B6410E|nr:uncharacterized protein LOC115540042 isoform X1 [Gadus morhua]XP_030206883.1 uncharacterized protein LOC115540042 isoform X1 [Gadus morhua]XP_030206884.1 uncharacterized protein LOC115540042 isoform X1 [Gadus morhua]